MSLALGKITEYGIQGKVLSESMDKSYIRFQAFEYDPCGYLAALSRSQIIWRRVG
jgi:hypothetical protein